MRTNKEAKLLAYLWNTQGVYPGDVYNRPLLEREFIYQATLIKIKEEQKAMRKNSSAK